MTQEYAKYDTDARAEYFNVRLTKDAQRVNDKFVKVTFVSTSKNDKDEDMWIDAIPLDSGADKASLLKKGDVLSVDGFLTMQKWGDNGDKTSFQLKFARMHYPIELLMQLKEREGDKPAKRKDKPGKATKKKDIIDLDDDAGADIE